MDKDRKKNRIKGRRGLSEGNVRSNVFYTLLCHVFYIPIPKDNRQNPPDVISPFHPEDLERLKSGTNEMKMIFEPNHNENYNNEECQDQ